MARPRLFLLPGVVLLIAAAVQRTTCKPQVYQYGVPVPLSVPYVGLWPPLLSPAHAPVIHVISGPSVANPHRFIRQEIPLPPQDQIEMGHEDNTAVFQGEGPVDHHQCGVIQSLTRSIGEAKRRSFESRAEGGGKGSVLLTSRDWAGPDLRETAFHQHKGHAIILSTKITYGLPTRNKEAPWQVAMFVKGKFHCGASIIGEKHILTAAHCVIAYKSKPKQLQLSLGDWDLETTTDGVNMNVEVKKVVAHSNFNFFNLQNDIAVLELTQNVVFNDRIRRVCLPPPDLAAEGEAMTVTGWGRNEKNLLQTRLHKLTAVALENTVCADRWSLSGAPRSLIGLGTMCMDTQFGDSCKGDSGGPAVMEHPAGSGIYVQAGIVSFGSGSCTDINLPGVYTRVASFRDWITEQMAPKPN